MRVGDMIRLIKIPAGLRDEDDLRTRTLFSLCLGKIFPIAGIDGKLIELEVGEILTSLLICTQSTLNLNVLKKSKIQNDPLSSRKTKTSSVA